jgi:outer membrane protein TolC
MEQTDRDVARLIQSRQRETIGIIAPARTNAPLELPPPGKPPYEYDPRPQTGSTAPDYYADISAASTQPASGPDTPVASRPAPDTQSAPTTENADPTLTTQAAAGSRGGIFTLTDALAYAQRYRRQYQNAKEELYVAALALTLERHLWTPIFSAEFRTVYGNYGEAQNFDQAMRFVADLGVSQRLPFGGEFTAQAIGTLVRDVGKTITAAEGSEVALGLDVPLLRGAGHVARETLIQLERELTYSVRTFERFRRQQLVTVADAYFGLLTAKQAIFDSEASLDRTDQDYKRARELEEKGLGSLLDTQRAEQNLLATENDLQRARERFRSQADEFKLLIGMPVDEPLGVDDLESIETIERKILSGVYPLLDRPAAADNEQLMVQIGLDRRFDLLTQRDRIDDARRGVEISRNALLPDLNWSGSLTFDTDPETFSMAALEFDRANWRTELVLELPVERFRERNNLRQALIDVRASQRQLQEQTERVRVEIRRAVNNIRLQDRLLEIARRSVVVNERQRDYAQFQFEEGDINNRDKLEAERNLLRAQNEFNAAKTQSWSLLLQLRLATETLRVDEDGVQYVDPLLPPPPPRRPAPASPAP